MYTNHGESTATDRRLIVNFTREEVHAFFLGSIIGAVPGVIFGLAYSTRFAGNLGDFLEATFSRWVAVPAVFIVLIIVFVLILGIVSASSGVLLALFVKSVRRVIK